LKKFLQADPWFDSWSLENAIYLLCGCRPGVES
jgi:hypothetical protein